MWRDFSRLEILAGFWYAENNEEREGGKILN
jgi:hypothetical protein